MPLERDPQSQRFELELKGNQAREAAARLIIMPQDERAAWIKGMIKGVFNPLDSAFALVMDAPALKLSAPTKNVTDGTYTWMMNQVAKALAALMISRTDTDVWGEFVRSVHANMIAKGAAFDEDAQGG